jgi:hypothetical protein
MKTKKLLLTGLAAICFASLSMAQVPAYVPTNGLIGWWPFNGNANDLSGNGNNGTVNGATLTADRFGNTNKAYSFDGVNNYISTIRNYQSAFSVSLWFNPILNQQYNPLIDAFDSNWEIQLNNTSPDYVSFISANNYQELISTQTTQYNVWTNIVCTYSNNIVKFYLNGTLTDQFSANPLPNNNGNYYFGASFTGADQFYKGKLDDIGIWNRALTQQEISNLYLGANVGITENKNNSFISLYPNPSSYELTLTTTTNHIGSVYKIVDYTGKLILTGTINSETVKINTSELPAGIYMLQAGQNNLSSQKFIKQ